MSITGWSDTSIVQNSLSDFHERYSDKFRTVEQV